MGGLTTSADSNTVGCIAEMANVASTAGGSTASIMWFGYDPPQAGAGSNGLLAVSETERAVAGGADLSHFLKGLHDSRQGSGEGGDPRITVLGHSYGPTTLGYALTQVRDGVVDTGAFCGPPGVPAKDVSDSNMPSDSVYVMKNDQDIIGVVPNNGPMGAAPGSDMMQLSDPTEVPGTQHIEGDHRIDPGTGLVMEILGPIAGAGYEGYQDHVNYFDSTSYQDADTQKEIHKYLRQQGLPETDENVRAEIQRRQQENVTSQQREVSKAINGTKQASARNRVGADGVVRTGYRSEACRTGRASRASRRVSKTAGIPGERYGSSGVPVAARFKLPIVESEVQPVADDRRQAEGKAAADGRRPKET